MIRSLHLQNFTVFPKETLVFGSKLNVFVGENGAGKTHLLKLAYSVLAVSAEEFARAPTSTPTKATLQPRIAEKLVNVFRAESLGRIARRTHGKSRCDVRAEFFNPSLNVEFGFATQSTAEVQIRKLPKAFAAVAPAYLPTRELLTIFPGFVSLYEGHYLEFEETWRDTCLLLGRPLKRGVKETRVNDLLLPLEEPMGGKIELDKNGRFYLVTEGRGRMEMPLVAEGLRKLGMLARLIATGALFDKGCLFWDEPEANLNPRIIKQVAKTIVDLSNHGIQVFVATHSLFLLRELEMLVGDETRANPLLPPLRDTEVRYFGLHLDGSTVRVEQGPAVEDMGAIVVLDEELDQSRRYLQAGE